MLSDTELHDMLSEREDRIAALEQENARLNDQITTMQALAGTPVSDVLTGSASNAAGPVVWSGPTDWRGLVERLVDALQELFSHRHSADVDDTCNAVLAEANVALEGKQ